VRASNCQRRVPEFVREQDANSLASDRRSNHQANGLILKTCRGRHPWKRERSMNCSAPGGYPLPLQLRILSEGNYGEDDC